jgi:hypothetical protein
MEKLETFFIKTVVAAQQQAQPTSGAVSTTKIGNFLTQQTVTESILDKLVSVPVSQEAPPQAPTTQKVIPVETSESQPDEQLLSKLAGSAVPSPPESVIKDELVTPQPVESESTQQEQINESILDQLAGRPIPQNENEEQTDKSQAGDSGDA